MTRFPSHPIRLGTVARPGSLAVTLLVAGVALAGCSRPAAPATGGQEPPVASPRILRSPSEIVLPVDAYREPLQQRLAVAKAQDLLGQACMRRLGFDWEIPERVPSRRNDNERRYGVFDERLAATYGYHPEPDLEHDRAVLRNKRIKLSPAAMTAWGGKGPSSLNGREVPKGGCLGEARRQLGDGQEPAGMDLPDRLATDSMTRAETDSRVRNAWQQWSGCMRKAGYHYRTPWDAHDDPGWWQGPGSSRREIATATADVRCRKETNLVGVWMAVEAAYQQQAIERNPEALANLKRLIEIRGRNAASVLAGVPR
jgi:hypothetical protein